LDDPDLVGQAHAQTALAQAASNMMGHAATRDAKEPEPVLGRRRDVLEAPPCDNEDLGHHVVDLVPRNSTRDVRGDIAKMERVRPLKFHLSLIDHPVPRSYSAQYLLITTTHARECPKPVNIGLAFATFIGPRVNNASPFDSLTGEWWGERTPPKREIRGQNRIRLFVVLGEKLFQQSFVAGQQLTCEQIADLAFGRTTQLENAAATVPIRIAS